MVKRFTCWRMILPSFFAASCAPYGRLQAVTNISPCGRQWYCICFWPPVALPMVAYKRLRMFTPCGRQWHCICFGPPVALPMVAYKRLTNGLALRAAVVLHLLLAASCGPYGRLQAVTNVHALRAAVALHLFWAASCGPAGAGPSHGVPAGAGPSHGVPAGAGPSHGVPAGAGPSLHFALSFKL